MPPLLLFPTIPPPLLHHHHTTFPLIQSLHPSPTHSLTHPSTMPPPPTTTLQILFRYTYRANMLSFAGFSAWYMLQGPGARAGGRCWRACVTGDAGDGGREEYGSRRVKTGAVGVMRMKTLSSECLNGVLDFKTPSTEQKYSQCTGLGSSCSLL